MAGLVKHGGCPGGEPTKEYKAFQHLKQRIKNPDSYAYGLKLGFADFQEFLEDIGPCPNSIYSVDRIRNEEGYVPGNVRWASRETQNNNRRNILIVNTPKGQMSLKKACREYGRPYMKTYHDFKSGKSINWEN